MTTRIQGGIKMQNEGKTDRIIRVVVGLAVLSLLFIIPGNLKYLGLIGLVPLLTGIIGICPIYAIFHISTNKKK